MQKNGFIKTAPVAPKTAHAAAFYLPLAGQLRQRAHGFHVRAPMARPGAGRRRSIPAPFSTGPGSVMIKQPANRDQTRIRDRCCRNSGRQGQFRLERDMRNALCIAGAALMAMALLPAGPAASQGFLDKLLPGAGSGSPEVWKACEGQDGASLDKQIEACTVVIDADAESDTVMAGAYTDRGNALRENG